MGPLASRVNLADVLKRYGVTLPLRGNQQKKMALCPVHREDSPSCSVDLQRQVWHCFGCGKGGDALDLVAIKEGLDLNTAAGMAEVKRILRIEDGEYTRPTPSAPSSSRRTARDAFAASQAPTEPAPDPGQDKEDTQKIEHARALYDACQPLQQDSPGAWYLESRGVWWALAAAAGTRYHPSFHPFQTFTARPAVVFPVTDLAGELVAVQGRAIAGIFGYKNGKPLNKLTVGKVSFGVFCTVGALDGRYVIVTEAPIDSLSLAAVGLPSLALVGTGYPAWLIRAIGSRCAYLATDNDPLKDGEDAGAGDRTAKRLCDELAKNGGRIIRLKSERAKDWNAYLTSVGPAAMETDIIRAAFPDRKPTVVTPRLDLSDQLPAGASVILPGGVSGTVTGYRPPEDELPAGSAWGVTEDGRRWDDDARGLRDGSGSPLVPYSLWTWREKIIRARGELEKAAGELFHVK